VTAAGFGLHVRDAGRAAGTPRRPLSCRALWPKTISYKKTTPWMPRLGHRRDGRRPGSHLGSAPRQAIPAGQRRRKGRRSSRGESSCASQSHADPASTWPQPGIALWSLKSGTDADCRHDPSASRSKTRASKVWVAGWIMPASSCRGERTRSRSRRPARRPRAARPTLPRSPADALPQTRTRRRAAQAPRRRRAV